MIQPWDENEPWPGEGKELLIIGPPGTGKTRRVLEKYVFPVIDGGGAVLATSYTKAAARELRERTAKRLGGQPGDYRESLTTIHSEANRRCKHLGFRFSKGGMTVVGAQNEEEDWAEEINRLISRGGDDYSMAWGRVRNMWPGDREKSIEGRLSRLFSGERLDEAAEWVRMDMHGRYDEAGELVNPDFTTLLEQALDVGSDRNVDLLAIDEAQDLTPLQWALMDRWAMTARRVLIVGDPDQAIYGWSGADGERLLRWLRDGRDARRLAKSWRVPSSVHRLARRVVVRIGDRIDAPYEPAERPGDVKQLDMDVALSRVSDAQEGGRSVLMLSRTRKGCGAIVDELLEDGIPHIAERGRRVLNAGGNAMEIAACLNSLVLHRAATTPARARKLISALSSKGPMLGGRRGLKKALTQAVENHDGKVGMAWLGDNGLDVAGLARAWEDPDTEWWKSAMLASRVSADDLLTVREWLAFHGSLEALMRVAGLVVVTTAHGSKGREADLVVLDARTITPVHKKPKPDELQTIEQKVAEDLRCLYVAVTRAMHDLVIVRGEWGKRDWLDLHGVTP